MLAALGVAVLAIAIVAIRHPDGRSANAGAITQTSTPGTSRPAPTSSHSTHPSAVTSPPAGTGATSTPVVAKLPLVVLNNTTVHGLAQQARQTFESGGWTVTGTGNLTNDILSTCAYYDPGITGAQAAATALMHQFPAIKRTAPKFAELPAGPIVVVLTPDYTSG